MCAFCHHTDQVMSMIWAMRTTITADHGLAVGLNDALGPDLRHHPVRQPLKELRPPRL